MAEISGSSSDSGDARGLKDLDGSLQILVFLNPNVVANLSWRFVTVFFKCANVGAAQALNRHPPVCVELMTSAYQNGDSFHFSTLARFSLDPAVVKL
jgi:hypothetical protein